MYSYFEQSYKRYIKYTYMKKIILALIAIVLIAVLPVLKLESIQDKYLPSEDTERFELRAEATEIFAKGLSYKTISQAPIMIDSAAFEGLFEHLQASYPTVYEKLQIDTVSTHTLWMKLDGTSANAENMLFISHLDVVPVDPKTIKDWEAEPFAGEIVDDYVYGRGALDDKASAFGILEALETLLSNDWKPSYNFYFCFGQDEEIGGRNGAGVAAAMCREKGITFRTIFDEAGTISVGSVPGLENTPVALIGVAEKGYISVEVGFEQPGGHSSMPDTENAILSASAFITSLNEDPIFKPEFTEPLQGFMTHLAPEMSFGLKWAFGLRPLTNSLILGNYQGSSTGRALTTNTAVATMVGAGIKDNVVPSSSRVVCNTRILPGYSVDDIVNAYGQRAADYGGTVKWYNDYGAGPTATSSFEGEDFLTLGQSIRATFPEALVSPYLTLGGTDSKNFDGLAKQTYRFLPIALTPEDLPRIHGINERLHVDAYRDLCRFYLDLFQRI